MARTRAGRFLRARSGSLLCHNCSDCDLEHGAAASAPLPPPPPPSLVTTSAVLQYSRTPVTRPPGPTVHACTQYSFPVASPPHGVPVAALQRAVQLLHHRLAAAHHHLLLAAAAGIGGVAVRVYLVASQLCCCCCEASDRSNWGEGRRRLAMANVRLASALYIGESFGFVCASGNLLGTHVSRIPKAWNFLFVSA
uniref:Uncharacterized protein n=1 Tax=Oryza nivara TaxID=4536 RepID=A0A0E0HNU0_ORYNI